MLKRFNRSILFFIKNTDKILLNLCLFASVFSVFVLHAVVINFPSVNSRIISMQIIATALGIVGALITSLIDYKKMAKLWKIHLPICVLLIVLTYFIGIGPIGIDDKAWLPLPFGQTFQPSELFKISFIITFASYLSIVKDKINQIPVLISICAYGGISFLLVFLQGDDGSALVFILIFFIMLFSAGISYFYVLIAGLVGALTVPLAWLFLLDNDKRLRILTVFNPNLDPEGIGYQQLVGKTAITSGGLFGNGLYSQDNIYVPELQNDFIFSFIGSTLGFIGCFLTLLLIFCICFKILSVGSKSRDELGNLICVGVFAMILAQSIINIGMCVGVMPVIGITLPFISSGGSSILTLYLSIGVVLSVYRHNNAFRNSFF